MRRRSKMLGSEYSEVDAVIELQSIALIRHEVIAILLPFHRYVDGHPDVTTLPQTNIPISLTAQNGWYQFDEELTGALGGFRVRSLRPLSVPEPGALALFGLGLLGLAAGRQVRREK